jgi:hypothetical protein
MSRLLGDRSIAVGQKFSLGDIAFGTVLGYHSVRFAEFDWRRHYPNLAAFSARIEERPSFASTVPIPQKISDKIVQEGADFWPGQRCRGCRRRPLASESDHHHLARRAPLPDAVVSPPKIGGVDGAKHFCERRPDLAVVDHLRKS